MKRPAFQFYPGDWLSSLKVMLMNPEQEGAYIRLLCYDWSGDGIPDDDQTLSVLSRMGEGWFNGGSTVIRNCFIPHPSKDGFITNERLQSEREKQDQWREKSKQGGIKSAASRRKKGSRVVQPNVNQLVEPKANSSSSISSSTSKSKGTLSELQEFSVSIGLPSSDGDFMFHKWEESGWKNSGKPVKDWKAGILKWKSQGWLPSQKVQQLFTSKDSQNYGI